ncbi:hypothetical protein ACFQ6V_16555 [Streptomyces roseifaciens]
MPHVTEDFVPHLIAEYVDALPTPGRAALGVADAPNTRFDTVLMGRGTYAQGPVGGLTSPYAHLRQIVFSRDSPPDPALYPPRTCQELP